MTLRFCRSTPPDGHSTFEVTHRGHTYLAKYRDSLEGCVKAFAWICETNARLFTEGAAELMHVSDRLMIWEYMRQIHGQKA